MKIEVLVQGGPDITQFNKIFSYEEFDKLIFFESTQLINIFFMNMSSVHNE